MGRVGRNGPDYGEKLLTCALDKEIECYGVDAGFSSMKRQIINITMNMNMNMNVTPLVRFFGFVSASHNSFVGCPLVPCLYVSATPKRSVTAR